MGWKRVAGALAVAVAGLAVGGACSWPKATILVEVTGDASGLTLDELVVSVRSVRLDRTVDLTYGPAEGTTEITLTTTLEVGLTGDVRTDDDFEVTVTARSAGVDVMAGGPVTATIRRGHQTEITVMLERLAGGCGDGAVDAGEACDGSDLAGNDCVSIAMGFDGGVLGCSAGCTFDTSGCTTAPVCGDGTAEAPEECDTGDLAGNDCTSIGMGFVGGVLTCTPGCTFDTGGCTAPPGCGDMAINGMEDCDPSATPPVDPADTCSSVTGGSLTMGTLACGGGCVFDASGCNECGNATAEGAEVCDGSDLAGGTCMTEGFDGGTLACAAPCDAFDAIGCFDAPTVPVLRRPINNSYMGSVFVGVRGGRTSCGRRRRRWEDRPCRTSCSTRPTRASERA